jgi:hypothetical protein
MTKAEAVATFRKLVQQYGVTWGKDVPPEAWAQLRLCNMQLSEADRRKIADGEEVT